MSTDTLRAALDAALDRKHEAVRAWSAADAAGATHLARNASARIRYWERKAAEAHDALHPVVALDLDTVPMLEGWEARGDFTRTPVWQPRRGMSVHVGGGVFVTVCAECDYAMQHRGVVPRYATTGRHEVAEHGALVGGINVGLLS